MKCSEEACQKITALKEEAPGPFCVLGTYPSPTSFTWGKENSASKRDCEINSRLAAKPATAQDPGFPLHLPSSASGSSRMILPPPLPRV